MPFTPFHLGPAAALKVMMPTSFSFMVFGFTQVLMDIEPLYYMNQGMWPIHRVFHTYVGATGVAIVATLTGKSVCTGALRLWNWGLDASQRDWLEVEPKISWVAALTGVFVGAYSHVLLDSIMHGDVRPLAPFSDGNELLGVISLAQLHWLCVGVGIVGGALLLLTRQRKRPLKEQREP
jgi:hypothetical protein